MRLTFVISSHFFSGISIQVLEFRVLPCRSMNLTIFYWHFSVSLLLSFISALELELTVLRYGNFIAMECRLISLFFVFIFFLQLWKSVLQWKRCASFVGQWNVEVEYMYTAHPIPNTSNAKAYLHLQVKVLLLPCEYLTFLWFGHCQLSLNVYFIRSKYF